MHRISFIARISAIGLVSAATLLAAQQPRDATLAQREAMHKLSFLVGNWTGPITIQRGPGETVHLTQSETIEYKLGGLVLLIEGRSTAADGSTPFQALATVAFDEASHSYRIRAYHEGQYVDRPLTVQAGGFSWGFDSGPAHVANTMHLTAKGEWQESTDVTFGGNPPFRSVEMLLTHQR